MSSGHLDLRRRTLHHGLGSFDSPFKIFVVDLAQIAGVARKHGVNREAIHLFVVQRKLVLYSAMDAGVTECTLTRCVSVLGARGDAGREAVDDDRNLLLGEAVEDLLGECVNRPASFAGLAQVTKGQLDAAVGKLDVDERS